VIAGNGEDRRRIGFERFVELAVVVVLLAVEIDDVANMKQEGRRRCDRVARGRYRVTVREAVGIVALPSLQLVVEPKIPAPTLPVPAAAVTGVPAAR